jgi:hypothetical protein
MDHCTNLGACWIFIYGALGVNLSPDLCYKPARGETRTAGIWGQVISGRTTYTVPCCEELDQATSDLALCRETIRCET